MDNSELCQNNFMLHLPLYTFLASINDDVVSQNNTTSSLFIVDYDYYFVCCILSKQMKDKLALIVH